MKIFKGGKKMRRSVMIVLTLALILPGLLTTVACSKKKTGLKPSDSGMSAEEQARLDAQKQRELEEAKLAAKKARKAQMMAEAKKRFVNDHVHFAYDSAVLTPIAQNILNQKAEWLRANPSANVVIGGHCDERGTIEYNVALGERRAESAKKYLVNLGIDANRLETISYGEERPIATGSNEEAWAQNRRAQFTIK